MGENFQAGVCGSTLWSSSRGLIGFSPCLVSVNNDYGSFGWPSHDLLEIKARSSAHYKDVSNLTSNQGPILFDQFMLKPNEGSLIDPTLEMMDISRSSTSTTTTTDWSQTMTSESGSDETNYQRHLLQENMSYSNIQLQKDWNLKIFSRDSTINELRNSQGFAVDPSSYNYPSNLMENLFGDDQIPLENQTMNFPSTTSYQINLNEISPSLAKLPSSIRPFSQHQRQEIDHLDLTNNISFWNISSAAPIDTSASIFPSTHLAEKSNFENLKSKSINGAPALKRQRIETPSPLPTFKVRKEKLGDRITALQQLVSPFGKTDTASVLQEAIEYISFLHDQVNVLSTPYMKKGASIQQQQNFNCGKDLKGQKKDLRDRGLCLVPISSTFPMTTETTVDFWTPTSGRTYR